MKKFFLNLKFFFLIFLCLFLSGCNGFFPIMPNVPSNYSECNICNLPTYPVSVKILEGNSSYFLIELKDVGSGYDIYDGIWKGWCADNNTTVTLDEWYQGNIYCSYDPPCNLANIAWPKINWIINNKGFYNADYVQDCIWHFTNGISPNEWAEWAGFLAMNFCPNENQKYAAIIDIPGKQPTIIEVPVAQASSVYPDKIEYRAFLVGVGDYKNFDFTDGDLVSPSNDVDRLNQVLNQCKFGSLNTEFSSIEDLKDTKATKSAILQGIKSTFAGADSNDISYFYFRGHGFRVNNTSYLAPTDSKTLLYIPFYGISGTSSLISVDELENALSSIPGIKVVLLDCCYSGGFIGKGESVYDEISKFNNNVINTFSQSLSREPLTNNQYKVLTSCSYDQTSVSEEELEPFLSPEEIEDLGGYTSEPIPDIENVIEGSYGHFTAAFCVGCGYYEVYPYPADSNIDTRVSMYEIYNYIKRILSNDKQDIQIYTDDADFVIAEY